jgi:hypothetical protein
MPFGTFFVILITEEARRMNDEPRNTATRRMKKC